MNSTMKANAWIVKASHEPNFDWCFVFPVLDPLISNWNESKSIGNVTTKDDANEH